MKLRWIRCTTVALFVLIAVNFHFADVFAAPSTTQATQPALPSMEELIANVRQQAKTGNTTSAASEAIDGLQSCKDEGTVVEARYVSSVGQILASLGTSTPEVVSAKRTLAITVLLSKNVNDVPIVERLEICDLLQDVPSGQSSVLAEREWALRRHETAAIWLDSFDAGSRSSDSAFDKKKLPSLDVAPPQQSGLPAGVSPADVIDPLLRAQYERDIAQNANYSRYYLEQTQLRRKMPIFTKHLERFLINAYSLPPVGKAELKDLLDSHHFDPLAKARIFSAIGG